MNTTPKTLSPDVVSLGVPDLGAAHAFYTAALSPVATGHDLDLHGTARVSLHDIEELAADARLEAATSGFRGFVMSYVVAQPGEVEAVLAAAVRGGATVLKPAKKSLFAGFSAVFRAPDGAIWKLAAPTRKDTGPVGDPPVPDETGALLGVAEPKVSRAFYEALGMTVDRDYGDKYLDFHPAPGTCRFALMPRQVLAKDAGVGPDGSGFPAVTFTRAAGSRDEVDALLAAAATAGGRIAVAAGETGRGGYAGRFTDPDGFPWQVTCP